MSTGGLTDADTGLTEGEGLIFTLALDSGPGLNITVNQTAPSFLLLESGFFLLLEDGGRILLG